MASSDFVDITSILGTYSTEVDRMVKEVADEVAKDSVKKVKAASPV